MESVNPWLTAAGSAALSAMLFGGYLLVFGRIMPQRFREDGPQHHLNKGRLPTGAGIIIVLLLLACAGWLFMMHPANSPGTSAAIAVCLAAAAVGLLGFFDDRLKVRHGSAGLKARYKFPIQIAAGVALLYFVSASLQSPGVTAAGLPLIQPWPAEVPMWLFYGIGLFIWLGALNGANFTDGLDGLLATTTLVVLVGSFYALLDGAEPLAQPAAVGTGCLLAYLAYNWKPAKLYIGDSGSLAVGALVAGLFIAKGWWFFLGLCVFVWVIEVASVMAQVAVYRRTKRRILLMSPLHHHFELAGWSERTVVLVFAGLQALGCLAAFIWLRHGVTWGLTGLTLLTGILAVLLLKYHRRAHP